MADTGEFEEEFVGSLEGFDAEPDEEGCINYLPGMLAQMEGELNALRDRVFAEDLFFGCRM